MNYLSVCSGIEAATCAWHPLGWNPVAFSEIEKFPSQVLAHHYPSVPNLGDMTKFEEWPDATIDLLVGGTPCQSFSVAGLRKGLADPRGNLMLTYGAIARRYRPKWLVWENVPGVLSSNGGRDFGTFLGMLGQLGYGFSYRVLDAQFFGVAQRRRRVFVVGCLGDWRSAAAVLFERHSLQGNPAPSREAGEGVARGVEIGPGGGRFTDLNPTLDTRAKDGQIRNQLALCVMEPAAYAIQAGALRTNPTSGPGGVGVQEGHAYTLEARSEVQAVCVTGQVTHTIKAEGFDASEDGTGRGQPIVAFSCKDHGGDAGPMSPTLRSMGHDGSHANAGGQVAVAWAIGSHAGAADGETTNRSHANGGPVGSNISEELSYSLRAGRTQNVATAMQVRRLTPRECERLQGFPDDYTLIPVGKKMAADGPRYKALGNSMAVPCMTWIGKRIQLVEQIKEKNEVAA